MRKILSIFLSLILICSLTTNVSALNNYAPSYSEYLQLVEDGILGEDISFSTWSESVIRSKETIDSLRNSSLFQLVYAGPSRALANITLQSGDIILTDDANTAWGGVVGHSGIAVGTNKILHIAGQNYTPSYIYLDDWTNNKYTDGYTYIYRCSNVSAGANAATWGVNNYGATYAPYHNASYAITSNITSCNPTYCSKIVWQCYYFGAGSSYVDVPITGLIQPFDLPNYISSMGLIHII